MRKMRISEVCDIVRIGLQVLSYRTQAPGTKTGILTQAVTFPAMLTLINSHW